MGHAAKRAKRAERNRWRTKYITVRCTACGNAGPHYVPPGCGDEGFYWCTQVLLDGKAVAK